MPRKGFQSAFGSLGAGLTPAQILAFHKSTFGDFRMSNDDPPAGGAGGSDTGSSGPGGDAGSGDAGSTGDGDRGFPENTPWRDMTEKQQVAYWQHQARKHEATAKNRGDYEAVVAERDRLKQQTQTDAERAIDAAKTEALAAGKAEARALFVPELVKAKLEAALAGKMPADKVAGQVEFLDHTKFLTETGEVDTDKVKQYASSLVPAGTTWPDMGNGNRGQQTKTSGVASGAERYAEKAGKK